MYCFKCSEDEVRDWWRRISTGQNLMKVYVPWCLHMVDQLSPQNDYIYYTMAHYDEFIAFIARKKLKGEYHEPKR